jgi:hypothetical protein
LSVTEKKLHCFMSMTSANAQYHTAMQNHVWKMTGDLRGMSIATINGVGRVTNEKPPH